MPVKGLEDCERLSSALINIPQRMPEVDRTSAACSPSDRSEFFQYRAESAPNQLCTVELQVACCKTGVEYVHHNIPALSPGSPDELIPDPAADSDNDDDEIGPPSDMDSASPYSFEAPDNLIFN